MKKLSYFLLAVPATCLVLACKCAGTVATVLLIGTILLIFAAFFASVKTSR